MAQDRAPKPPKEQLTPEQQAAKRERANLELVRKKLQNDLATAASGRHKAMIESALKDVMEKLGS